MAYLFEVQGKLVQPSTEALMVEPFKSIWERDTTEKKENAIEELSYIEFMASMKKTNPYGGYKEHEKHTKIVKDVIHQEGWVPDELVLAGIEKIKKFQTEASTTYSYFMSAKVAAEKMNTFFTTFDMSAVNPKTFAPIYKPRDITSALNDTSRVLQNLNTLKEKVDQELFEETKIRGQKQISHFADPESLG